MGSKQKRMILGIIIAAFVATVLVGCGRGSVAKVDGRKITRQEFNNRLERLQYRDPQTGQQMEAGALVLQRLIGEELILRLAEQEKVAPTEQQVKARLDQAMKQPGFRQNMREQGITQNQLKELMRVEQAAFNLQTKGVEVTDEDVKEFYDNSLQAFTTPQQAELAAIFVENKEEADQAVDLLNNKNVEFGTVARTLSQETQSAQNNGRIGPISKGDPGIPAEVQDIIFATERNSNTDPIAMGDGNYVIFRVLAHRPERTQPLEEVEFDIKQRLMLEKGIESGIDINAMLEDYRQNAKIDIGIERYKKLLLPDAEELLPGEEEDIIIPPAEEE